MSAADQLAAVEAQMARCAAIHERTMRAWQSLRRERDTLRVMVEREDAALDRQAKRYLGPDVVRRSA